MRRIKWENLTSLLLIILFTICLLKHIELNGVYNELIIEIVYYSLTIKILHFIVKDIRKNKKNWF